MNKLNTYHRFWNKKYKPPYLTALEKINDLKDNIYQAEQIPVFSLDYTHHAAKCDISIPDFIKNDIHNNNKFKSLYDDKFKDFQAFYTDASLKLTDDDKTVGIGIYSPTLPLEYSRKLPSY